MTRNNWQVKQVTRGDFTHEEILRALDKHNHNLTKTAKELTKLGKGKVSRQLLRYWVNREDFSNVNAVHHEADAYAAKRRMQNSNTQLRRQVKVLEEALATQQDWLGAMQDAFEYINPNLPKVECKDVVKDGTKLTVELLISDLQIGKLTTNFNTEVAIARLKEVGVKAVQAIQQKKDLGYDVERVVVAFLGDIIESDAKHNDSARGCDSATSEQMANAIKYLYELILVPLGRVTRKLDCIGIVG